MPTAFPIANVVRYRNPAEMRSAFPGSCLHYENNGAILLEDSGIAFDEAFVNAVTFPPEWKKIGSANGITATPMVLHQGALARVPGHPLCQGIADDRMLLKVYAEILRLEMGFKLLVAHVLPSYGDVAWDNCTFRFVQTENEAPHLDIFTAGKPFREEWKRPRLKLFLNVDSVPRLWNVGPTLPDILKATRGCLGARLPADLNVLCAHLFQSGVLNQMPLQRVEIPPRGIIFVNGATVLHQVVYGRRMVGLEGLMPESSLQPASVCEWKEVRRWIAEAGYEATDEFDATASA